MEEKNWIQKLSIQNQMDQVMKTNKDSAKFGLTLSEDEANLLLQERRECLKEQERVEFGEGILPKLIFAFCDSPYIYQDNYVETLGRLQEIFYLYKNESMDEATDDELIEQMYKIFELCEGSLDYLEDTGLEAFARSIRFGNRNRELSLSEEEEWEDE